jgi:hypothetical protein
MAALRTEEFEVGPSRASEADQRGSLGIHLNGSGEDLTAEEHIAFVGRQGLQG